MSFAAKKHQKGTNKKASKWTKVNARIVIEEEKKWKKQKSAWYTWARTRCANKGLTTHHAQVAEVIVSCCNLKGVTIASKETMLKMYKSKYPKNLVSRTRFYEILKDIEAIKVIRRLPQEKFNRTSAIKLLAPELVKLCVRNADTNNLSNKLGRANSPAHPFYNPNQDQIYLKSLDDLLKITGETVKNMT